ncbi:unnamed protein product [Sphagnum jensenii]|uniref:Membrane-associated kinase regulator 3 n=1 Tax=Sphagnum jensenii TaxID=128206 RepID=A0ABP1BUN2_9BRYO
MQFVNDNTSLDPSGGSMMSTGDRSVFPSNAAQEFEFNISSSFVERSCSFPYSATDSPADELFFRGQLLPLHLPPRLQMVLKLSSEKQQESEHSSSRESSSSRDSSGSSQDSCFSSSSGKLELRTTAASASENKASLHMNRVEVFNTQSCSSHTSNLSAWMRPTFNDCSGELSYSGDIGKAARAFERAILQADAHADHLRERDQRGLAKAREYIQKYMKILKPLNVKKDAKADAAADQESSKAGRSCKVTYTCNRQPAAPFLAFEKRSLRATSSSRSLPSFSRSSRFAPATNILLTPRRSPVMRSSSVGTPPLPCNSVSELHGAIQGAIAHCKESQISKP